MGDRIDYLYAAGPVDTLDSQLVGEEGGRGVELGFDPWTSDHRAVVSTFDVTPVPMPTMVSVNEALLTQGESAHGRLPGAGTRGYRRDVPSEADTGSPELTEELSGSPGTFDVETSGPRAGGARRGPVGRGRVRGRARRVLGPRPERADRGLDRPWTYGVGEPIMVSWTDGPANRWDWVGVYAAAKADPKVDYYLIGTTSASMQPEPFLRRSRAR